MPNKRAIHEKKKYFLGRKFTSTRQEGQEGWTDQIFNVEKDSFSSYGNNRIISIKKSTRPTHHGGPGVEWGERARETLVLLA